MAKAKREKITKTEAVRLALQNGKEVPNEGVAYIKEKFGIDIRNEQFSTYKSIIKAKGAGKTGRKKAAASGIDLVDAAAAVKELCTQIGAEKVKKLAGLFE